MSRFPDRDQLSVLDPVSMPSRSLRLPAFLGPTTMQFKPASWAALAVAAGHRPALLCRACADYVVYNADTPRLVTMTPRFESPLGNQCNVVNDDIFLHPNNDDWACCWPAGQLSLCPRRARHKTALHVSTRSAGTRPDSTRRIFHCLATVIGRNPRWSFVAGRRLSHRPITEKAL
ncbi:hypothetical protein LZ30DRAFT_722074 [Colletotrichum cereale]|nr:hypothetical protein LZ30DRAFT_722074 [Colletotrichum cereale]